MKRRTLLAAPLLLPAARVLAAPAAPGQAVVWPELRLLDGTALPAAHWQGRAAVVVFWSTTCPFCRRHNQHVERLYQAALALPGQPLRVLGVARENDAAKVIRYAQQQGYSFPITLDNRAMAAALSERRMIPLTAVVARSGQLKQVLPGEMFEEDVMELLQLAQPGARS